MHAALSFRAHVPPLHHKNQPGILDFEILKNTERPGYETKGWEGEPA